VEQLTTFRADFLQDDGLLALNLAVSMFNPALLSKSDKTMLSAVKQLLPVNSLFFVSVNKGMAVPAGK